MEERLGKVIKVAVGVIVVSSIASSILKLVEQPKTGTIQTTETTIEETIEEEVKEGDYKLLISEDLYCCAPDGNIFNE